MSLRSIYKFVLILKSLLCLLVAELSLDYLVWLISRIWLSVSLFSFLSLILALSTSVEFLTWEFFELLTGVFIVSKKDLFCPELGYDIYTLIVKLFGVLSEIICSELYLVSYLLFWFFYLAFAASDEFCIFRLRLLMGTFKLSVPILIGSSNDVSLLLIWFSLFNKALLLSIYVILFLDIWAVPL